MQHATDHKAAVAGLHDLHRLTLEMALGGGDPRRAHAHRGRRFELGPRELVLIGGKIRRRKIHLLHKVHRHDVDDELVVRAYVAQRVLGAR